ncbi:MAG TPA: hypothetical protein VGI39_21510, partial [Polyangiaceae bacterium]
MGQITILNNTNAPINSCISAGLNYSWVNSLSPKEFYVHDGAAGVYTLNTRFWLGEGTEYHNSGAEIGLWVGGIVLGIAGLVMAVIPGGGLLLAAAAAGIAGSGTAVAGISIAAKEFANEPSTWTNIQAVQDRKFIAEGKVDFDKGADNLVQWKNSPIITLRELKDEDYKRLVSSGEFVQYRADGDVSRITDSYLTKADVEKAGLLNTPLRITPSVGGNACWEVENDKTIEGTPMQLWDRSTNQVHWTLQCEPQPDNGYDVFLLYNRALNRYACENADGTS